ncbi:MAG: AMP-binding protein [Planctomycetes bacterium]|nr:AMP-binding protein [Planctomycetota bacterium]
MDTSAAPDDRLELERTQLDRLRGLLAALHPANAFYGKKLNGLKPDGSLAEFMAKAPFTFKRELIEDQQAHGPFGSNLTYPLERYTRFHQTSGSMGRPMRWLDTAEDWQSLLECWKRVFAAAHVGASDRVFFAFSFGPFLGFWTAFEAALQLGCLCIPGGGMSSQARLQAILENETTVLCCTPTYALRLAEVAREEGLRMERSRVQTILVAGEPGGSAPATRLRIEQQWPGARVYDHHGMTEVGPVSYACPARSDVLHVIEEAYLAEVVDPQSGLAAAAGKPGELVLTTLLRTGSPLLRYRTGDWVHPAAVSPCPCGSVELALEGGILGRTDDMVVVRGVNVYPSAVDEVVRSCGEVAEYRVSVYESRGMTEIKVTIEPDSKCGDAQGLARRLEERLREAFHLRVPVDTAASGALPRFEMKAKRWVRRDAE